MGQSSYSGRVRRISTGSFNGDSPVSANRSFDLRNNLLHLGDEFCQHRINWCAGFADADESTGLGCFVNLTALDAGSDALYEQEFQHTWLSANHPAGLDLLIRSAITANTGTPEMDVRVRVVPASYAIGDLGSPAIIDETHTVTDAFGEWEDQFFFDPSDFYTMNLLRSSAFRAEIVEDGEWHYPEVSMLKLQVHLKYVSGDDPLFMTLTGVLVREFA